MYHWQRAQLNTLSARRMIARAGVLGFTLQPLIRSRDFSLYGQLHTQWTGVNLDSSEKISLGGAYGWRGISELDPREGCLMSTGGVTAEAGVH